jgi:serine/threonine-protein kinase
MNFRIEELGMDSKLGSFRIVRSLGKGGMGEVFLAYDTVCKRHVALKQIRSDLAQHKTMQNRFLKEAHIAAQLTHPSIISIYAIDPELLYYTMPYVEGKTLKEIIRSSRELEKEGLPVLPEGSIPSLCRIFLSVCQAVAYTHSKKVLHRDLKPENIIVGKYGEVLILDWGLAQQIGEPEESPLPTPQNEELPATVTRPGKIVGTITYMAPERALGEPASITTEIYALGVILYQLLTLRLPFQRASLESYRKQMQHEEILDPIEAAPYREIPRQLSDLTKKCMAFSKDERCQSVEKIIEEIENYVEGRPEWVKEADLSIADKNDWEFQENVFMAKHVAISRHAEMMEWVNLMFSKASFPGNIRIETRVKIGPKCNGIGILLNVPEAAERKSLDEGYSLWIGSPSQKGCKLFRSNVEVLSAPDVALEEGKWCEIRIEKVDQRLRLSIDHVVKLNAVSHIPVTGTHVGLLFRDADFEMESLRVYVSSQNATVSCLSVPDAFLANKEFAKALIEYRRIFSCFSGRIEGREAAFRAGITLLQEGLSQKNSKQRKKIFAAALEEFEKLHGTPGAPLEYLGKSLVYKENDEVEEEAKCLELAIRKFHNHPLLPILIEHISLRLHEASYKSRFAAYHFALICLRHLPLLLTGADNQKLIQSLEEHLEPLSFIKSSTPNGLILSLAYWLDKPMVILEIVQTDKTHLKEAIFALIKLGYTAQTKQLIKLLDEDQDAFKLASAPLEAFVKEFPVTPSIWWKQLLLHLLEKNLSLQNFKQLLPHFKTLQHHFSSAWEKNTFDALHIQALLFAEMWSEASLLISKHPMRETTSFYFLMGALLAATKGIETALLHFEMLQEHVYPPTALLGAHFLTGKIDLKGRWVKESFRVERIHLYQQLALFYHSARNFDQAFAFQKKLAKELKPS